MTGIVGIMIYLIILVISSIPLYVAVRLLGGKTSLFKVIMVNIVAGIVISALKAAYSSFIWSILVFLTLLYIYKEMFRIGWLRSFFAWLMQFVIFAAIMSIVSCLAL